MTNNTSPRSNTASVETRTTPDATPAPAKPKRKPATPGKAPAKGKQTKTPVKATPATPQNCGCGCGKPTVTAKARFLSGHDARLAGVLGKARAAGTATPAQDAVYEGLSDRLKAKVDGIVATHRDRAAKKAAAEAARKVAKEAYDKAMAAALA